MKYVPLCLVAVSGLASIAAATVTEYNDRASFEAALGSVTIVDFEGLGDQNNQDSIYTLQPGYKALGMDIGLLFGAGNVNVTVRDGLGNIVASGSRSVADNDFLGQNGTTFYGWISDAEDIKSVQLDQGGFPTIDNATFARGIPAPGAAAVFGLAGLAAARRRRN